MEFVNNSSLWKTFLKNNGYTLRHQIGEGGYGHVFSAGSSSDGMIYAIKRLVSRRNIMADQEVMREIKAMAELDHPCIVHLQEVLLSDRLACIVMELASHGNLEMYLQNTAVSYCFVVNTFRQIACAIEFCHSRGIAHKDVNPSNILIFNAGLVKIADFGLCFRCKDETNDNEILCSDYLGQEAYLAPEVKLQAPYLAIPADIWSLGCVLIFLVSQGGSTNLESNSTSKEKGSENKETSSPQREISSFPGEGNFSFKENSLLCNENRLSIKEDTSRVPEVSFSHYENSFSHMEKNCSYKEKNSLHKDTFSSTGNNNFHVSTIPSVNFIQQYNGGEVDHGDITTSCSISDLSAKEFLCFAAYLKRIKPSERPTARELLHGWTKFDRPTVPIFVDE